MIDFSKPLFAKIFDFDQSTREDQDPFIIRQVEIIELPQRHHKEPIIWFSNGFRSTEFELIEQEADHDK